MSEKRHFLVTAALPYSNGRLHVGHIAGAYLPADIFVRYLRSKGERVAFICGSDDNGVPITLTARNEGRSPEEVVAFYHASQQRDFAGLGMSFDFFGGTTSKRHAKISQDFFLKVNENGFLTKKRSEQLYDTSAKMFLPDRYVKGTCHHCGHDGALGDQCEACGKTIDPLQLINPVSVITGSTPEVRETVHWFFELSQFEERLSDWLAGHKDEWRPMVINFASGLLKQGLPSRAITRDLEWGIPVPLDDDPDAQGKVLYVWFDAPIGYVSFTAEWCEQQGGDWKDYEQWWKSEDCEVIHFIGEDNVVFHAIMWPAMLMAEGSFQLSRNVVANCFLNIKFPGKEEEKISKSRGTAIWIEEYLKEFDPDPLRYYLTCIATEAQRTSFSLDDFVARNNDELVAALGNFFHRTMTFVHKYFDGKSPECNELNEADVQQVESLKELPAKVGAELDAFRFKSGLGVVMAAARDANKYFDTKAPWSQRKTDMPGCATTINICLRTARTLATVMAPFLPFAADSARKMLCVNEETLPWSSASDEIPAGTSLGDPVILFKKLDPSEVLGDNS